MTSPPCGFPQLSQLLSAPIVAQGNAATTKGPSFRHQSGRDPRTNPSTAMTPPAGQLRGAPLNPSLPPRLGKGLQLPGLPKSHTVVGSS